MQFTSTVGLPRLSRISRAFNDVIFDIGAGKGFFQSPRARKDILTLRKNVRVISRSLRAQLSQIRFMISDVNLHDQITDCTNHFWKRWSNACAWENSPLSVCVLCLDHEIKSCFRPLKLARNSRWNALESASNVSNLPWTSETMHRPRNCCINENLQENDDSAPLCFLY